MSDDLRKQIARAAQYAPHAPDDDPWLTVADAVLAVVQPVIEQAERERDEAARFGESTQDWLRARVATLEAALRRADDWMTYANTSYPYPTQLRAAARAALGDQDTTVTTTYGTENPVRKPKHLTYLGEQDTEGNPADRCPTCGSDDPARQQGLPHTDLHAQVRCRDPWHSAPPV